MKRQRYTDEFRLEAVRLMVMDGMSAPEVSSQMRTSFGPMFSSISKYSTTASGNTLRSDIKTQFSTRKISRPPWGASRGKLLAFPTTKP